MKKVSLLLTVLASIFVRESALAQFTQSQMVAEWQRAKAYTKAYLDAMPEDGFSFKPTPEIRSFAQQMLHISDANYVIVSVASEKPNPIGENPASSHNLNETTVSPTKEATTKAVMDSYDWVISTLQNMASNQLQETTKFGKHDNITRSGLFGKAFEHQTHTRGQTTIYLRLKGITPPAEKLF
ncbi:MAG: DinB family protein [Bacteroidetes bacterium]|nr:DinB family protein [Bacteroidota bacterium]